MAQGVFSRLTLSRQLLFALGGTVVLVGLFSGEFVRQMETEYLRQSFKENSHKTFSMLAATSIDAVVSEDRPLLETIVARSVAFDSDIISLTINNEIGEPLVTWTRQDEAVPETTLHFSEDVVFEGESFGSISIDWNVATLMHGIDSHVQRMRVYSMSVVGILATLLIFWIHRLVVSPINRIHRRVVSLGEHQGKEPLNLNAAQELVRLSQSVNSLDETLQLKHRRELELEDAQKSLSEARDRAIDASRAKSEFLANMSHELRTPMNGVLGMLSLLSDTQLAREQKRYVKVATGSGKTLLTLINDILDFSKIEAGRLELERIDFNLIDVIEDSVELLAEQAYGKGLEIVCLIAPDVPEVACGDPTRLRQVLTNLLANAVKFTERGEVSLTVERAPAIQANGLRFSVTDTGVGISQKAQARIFDSFTQADGSTTRQYGGSGLGLAISRQLAEHMNGEIGVKSELGKGSTFWFTAELEFVRNPQPVFTPEAAISGLRVLVVDSHSLLKEHISRCVEKWGMRCDVVSLQQDALLRLTKDAVSAKAFDLVIVNTELPDGDGWGLVSTIRATESIAAIPVIVLAPFSGEQNYAELARRAGANGHVSKPVRGAQLHDAIASAFNADHSNPSAEDNVTTNALSAPAPAHDAKILLVEDNEVNQEVASGMLAKLGYSVEVAANGLEALVCLQRTNFDLVLMDCQMPVLDGYETTARIRRGEVPQRSIAIIALTANAMEGDADKCLAAGMNDYLAKPIDVSELANKLMQWRKHESDTAPEPCEVESIDIESVATSSEMSVNPVTLVASAQESS